MHCQSRHRFLREQTLTFWLACFVPMILCPPALPCFDIAPSGARRDSAMLIAWDAALCRAAAGILKGSSGSLCKQAMQS